MTMVNLFVKILFANYGSSAPEYNIKYETLLFAMQSTSVAYPAT